MANALGEFLGGVASAIKDKAGIPQEVKMKPVEFADKISEIEVGKDVSGVTATADDVLTGKKIVDASGNVVDGTMQNNGAYQHDIYKDDLFMIAEGQYSAVAEIPKGYHDGNGKMTVKFQRRTIIPTKETQTINNSFYYPFIVNPIPDEYQDVSSVTATADDVRAGKVFVDAEGNEVEGALTGTIADVSEVTANAEDVLVGKVIVNSVGKKVYGSLAVQSGGGSLPAGGYWEALNVPYFNTYRQQWVEFNGDLYAFINGTSGNSGLRYIYKFINGAWSLVYDAGTTMTFSCASVLRPVEYNGKLHLCRGTTHYIFNGVSLVKKANLPSTIDKKACFVQNEKLKIHSYSNGVVYFWNESTDTWTSEATLSKYPYYFCTVNNSVYALYSNSIYRYENSTLTELVNNTGISLKEAHEIGNRIYIARGRTATNQAPLVCYEVNSGEVRNVGYIPFMANASVLVLSSYNNRLALISYDLPYPSTMVLHEVTE